LRIQGWIEDGNKDAWCILRDLPLKILPELPENIRSLDCSSCWDLRKITNLPSSLGDFMCDDTKIKKLPQLPSTLHWLSIEGSCLQSLPTLPLTLTFLNISKNILTELPFLPPTLEVLHISFCKLSSLPSLSHTSLRKLFAEGNSLTTLPPLPDTLEILELQGNQLQGSFPPPKGGVNTPLPHSLQKLILSRNLLTNIPTLNNHLTYLEVSYNPYLIMIGTLPNSLHTLYADNTKLVFLPNIPSSLSVLNLCSTYILSLPPLSQRLEYMNVSNSRIQRLPTLPSSLTELYLENTPVRYLPEPLPPTLLILHCKKTPLEECPPLPQSCKYYLFDSPLSKELIGCCSHEDCLLALSKHRRKKSKERQQQRCQHVKEELMAKTWHSKRMIQWCFDMEEQKEWLCHE
jgi:hypothetical protein